MESIKECRRCGNPVLERFQSIQKQPGAIRWVKPGYCSNAFFRKDRKDLRISQELDDAVSDKREMVREAIIALFAAFPGYLVITYLLTTPLGLFMLDKLEKNCQ